MCVCVVCVCVSLFFHIIPYVNCFGKTVLYIFRLICMMGAQGIDEHMINVQCYYYTHLFFSNNDNNSETLFYAILPRKKMCSKCCKCRKHLRCMYTQKNKIRLQNHMNVTSEHAFDRTMPVHLKTRNYSTVYFVTVCCFICYSYISVSVSDTA